MYASIVGILLYMSRHTCPDIAYSVSQVARFTCCPKQSGKRNKGLIISPTRDLNIDAYPDAEFAELYNYEEHSNTVCVRNRTGFIITVAGCPVFWKSQLQTETATSTIQAEVIALAACC